MTFTKQAGVAVLIGCALFGAGCWKSGSVPPAGSSAIPASGSKSATFDGLTPRQAAEHIHLVSPSVITLKQTFTGPGRQIARDLGWGAEVDRDIVIRSFAPAHEVSFEWTASTTAAATSTKKGEEPKMEHRVYTGSILSGDLQSGHELLLPSYWTPSEHSAFSTSALWLSSEVFADLVRNRISTLEPGITHSTLFGEVKGSPALISGAKELKKNVETIIGRTDVYLTRSQEPTTMTLKLNGKDTTVEVIKASNWFGNFTFLNATETPLIVEAQFNNDRLGGLAGLFDYRVTELRDLTDGR